MKKGSALTYLYKQFLKAALQSKPEQSLVANEGCPYSNFKNGKVIKTVKTGDGKMELFTSRTHNVQSFLKIKIQPRQQIIKFYSLFILRLPGKSLFFIQFLPYPFI